MDSELSQDVVGERLEQLYGVNTKTDLDAQLSRGLIGTTLDLGDPAVVVVVDPGLIAVEKLQADLGEAIASGSNGQDTLPVRVQPGCYSSAELLVAGRIIRARDWHPAVEKVSYGGYLDARTSTYQMTFEPGSEGVAEALKTALGGRVDLTFDKVGRANRGSDGQPHWGGAGIGVGMNDNVCTSGFTVDTLYNGKAMVTAGHCFNNNQTLYSGNEPYGSTRSEANYPAYDMILINGPQQNYDDDLYHNPIFPQSEPIDVDGGLNAADGTYLCISGRMSLAVCDNEVVNASTAQLCDVDGCTYGLVASRNPGAQPCIPGDSGAPMYRRRPSVLIRAVLIGHVGNTCVGERTSSVESHLNVTVASQP